MKEPTFHILKIKAMCLNSDFYQSSIIHAKCFKNQKTQTSNQTGNGSMAVIRTVCRNCKFLSSLWIALLTPFEVQHDLVIFVEQQNTGRIKFCVQVGLHFPAMREASEAPSAGSLAARVPLINHIGKCHKLCFCWIQSLKQGTTCHCHIV